MYFYVLPQGTRHWNTGSFGLEVSGGQRKFPGGQNCSKTSLGSRLNWQAEALRARIDS